MAHGDPLPKNYYANTAPVVEDWADMVRFEPGLYARPKSLDELQQTLSRLVSGGLPADGIRVLGGLHSCAHICECAAVIDVTALPQTLEFDADDSAVVATANWHLHAFLEECGKRGKSLAATGGTDAQTLAGLISTNTAPATPKATQPASKVSSASRSNRPTGPGARAAAQPPRKPAGRASVKAAMAWYVGR